MISSNIIANPLTTHINVRKVKRILPYECVNPKIFDKETLQSFVDFYTNDLNPHNINNYEEVCILNEMLDTWIYVMFLFPGLHSSIDTFIVKESITDFRVDAKVLNWYSKQYDEFSIISKRKLPSK